MWKLPLFELNYNSRETNAVKEVLNSKWLTMGEKTLKLEDDFSNYLGKKNKCIAVSSCTAALHLSMIAAGVKRGDEVIVPSLSFIAQLNIIKTLGANPILVDCNSLDDWNMNLSSVLNKITLKTKVIVILHFAGYPCNITDELISLCKKKNIILIEDVAHAPGAEINKKKCGTIGDIGCFSFFSNKNISAGEGGLITTKNKMLEKKIRLLRSHGMTVLSLDKTKGRSVNYDVLLPGFNYRIDEIRSSLANIQLEKLDKANFHRQKNVLLYKKLLKGTKIGLPFANLAKNIISAYHILPILLPKNVDRKKVVIYLKKNGVQTSIHYPAFWSFTEYKNVFDANLFPTTNEITSRELTLPLYPTMDKNNIKFVCDLLIGYLNER
jgi:dTDP-4-amino-4,6-dideoxygalactose transaminase